MCAFNKRSFHIWDREASGSNPLAPTTLTGLKPKNICKRLLK